MSNSILTINGRDFTPFLHQGGFTYTKHEVDSHESGELLDGTMRRKRKIVRPALKLEFIKSGLTDEQVGQIFAAIEPVFFNVTYPDPRFGGAMMTRKFYTNAPEATFISNKLDKKWKLSSITLVAKGVAGDGESQIE